MLIIAQFERCKLCSVRRSWIESTETFKRNTSGIPIRSRKHCVTSSSNVEPAPDGEHTFETDTHAPFLRLLHNGTSGCRKICRVCAGVEVRSDCWDRETATRTSSYPSARRGGTAVILAVGVDFGSSRASLIRRNATLAKSLSEWMTISLFSLSVHFSRSWEQRREKLLHYYPVFE